MYLYVFKAKEVLFKILSVAFKYFEIKPRNYNCSEVTV